LQKIEGFVLKRGSFALQKPFLLLITTKRSCWHITIGDRERGKIVGKMEISGPYTERQRFYGSLKTCKITRICMENHWGVTGGQSDFFSYKSF